MNDIKGRPRYNRFSDHLRKKFGCRVYKISLDAGLSCPNRDGTISENGCIFCDPQGGSGRRDARSKLSITQQIQEGKEGLKRRYRAEKFIAYFQTFSNTYGPMENLKALYNKAVVDPDVVGLSIATRPDCLGEDTLDLIQDYRDRYETWIELGIQSLKEDSLSYIERGHGVGTIKNAVAAIKQRRLQICAHLILGLPGESEADMVATIKGINELGIEAVKFHMLYITDKSRLLEALRAGEISLMKQEEYVAAVVHLLEHLAPSTLIQRLVSEAHPEILVAPEWLKHKSEVIRAIDQRLEDLNTRQGRLLSYPREKQAF
jgi:radical SAM protein (TIGR01212 family)